MPIPELLDLEVFDYWIGDELDPLALWWFGAPGPLVPFGTEPCTFQATAVSMRDLGTALFTKVNGFVGTDGTGDGSDVTDIPNLTIVWDGASDLNSLTVRGKYVLTTIATRIADGKQRTHQCVLWMRERY